MTIALHGGGVKLFSYTEDILNDLEASVSPERMGTYLNATGGNREKAFHLYAWNTATSAAFYGPLQGLEVVLRNAIHRQLAGRYGAAWYDNPAAGLNAGCLERIAKATPSYGSTGLFSYTEDILNDLEASVSPERMGTYLNATGGNREKAFHLYAWNTATSAAFYGPLQGLEVVLRNAIHRQLAGRYGAAWYETLRLEGRCRVLGMQRDHIGLWPSSLSVSGFRCLVPAVAASTPLAARQISPGSAPDRHDRSN